ncbi:MAG: GNAT family N-acetyltransferase, partial [Clostridia bacterium]|nr:GNAT family N-acetyltransferase [Clostridia bacterium]
MCTIRKTTLSDLDRVMQIYAIAKRYMDEMGNPTQWAKGYPPRDLIEEDIARGESYVVLKDGTIHGVFVFMQRIEPTYAYIEDGAWLNDAPYGTIHRVASDGECRRMFDTIVAYCRAVNENLRVDTHHDNLPMQKAIERGGFVRCGIIYVENGTKRIAYQMPNQKA